MWKVFEAPIFNFLTRHAFYSELRNLNYFSNISQIRCQQCDNIKKLKSQWPLWKNSLVILQDVNFIRTPDCPINLLRKFTHLFLQTEIWINSDLNWTPIGSRKKLIHFYSGKQLKHLEFHHYNIGMINNGHIQCHTLENW